MDLKGKHFLKLLDFTPEEIEGLLSLAAELKAKKKAGIPHQLCQGKNIALIFEKTSTRTRCSFEVAAHDLGMGVTYLDPSGSQIGKKESIPDTARVLGRMFDGIEYRGYGQDIVEELAQYAGVPVWNGLTNEFHPTDLRSHELPGLLRPVLSSHPDSGRFSDYPRALRRSERQKAGLHGRRPVQHGQLLDGGLRQDGHAFCGLRP